MNRAERRAAERKAADFVARMKAAKDAKKVAALTERLVVKKAVVLPDARALALVAQYRTKQIKRYLKKVGTTGEAAHV